MMRVEVGKCYKIAGRPPVYILALEYGAGKRVLVRGVKPKDMILYIKHHIIDEATLRTVAEVEGLPHYSAKGVSFRFNSTSKIEQVNIRELVPEWEKYHPTHTTDEIDKILKAPRV